jgi:hypothetical protein
MIDPSCPVIFGGNWQQATDKGWRWECNLAISHTHTPKTIEDYQKTVGADRVTIGHPFSETKLRPEPVEDLVSAHVAELDDDEAFAAAVAAWADGEEEAA